MTLPNDTLPCDTARLAYWQTHPKYDYGRDLLAPDVDLIRWLEAVLGRFLRKMFGSHFAEEYTGVVLIVLFLLIVLFIIWFLYKRNPKLFVRAGGRKVSYAIHEDTIYGIDFQFDIDSALARQDYREAVRLLYLQTLKTLSDKEMIEWQLYKTPTQYLYEVNAEELKEPFRNLTNHFLRVRYGNFEATAFLFNEMKTWQHQMEKGGLG